MLNRLRTKASLRFRKPSKHPRAPVVSALDPAPAPTPTVDLTAYVELLEMHPTLEAEGAARVAADQLMRKTYEELASEALAQRMEQEERERHEGEEEASREVLRKLQTEMIEENLRRENGVFECPICADELFRGEALVACWDGHALCLACAAAGSKAAFENFDSSLRCLADNTCEASYLPEDTNKFLDGAQMEQLEKIRRQKDVAVLKGEGLLQCPFCDYAALYEDADDLTYLDCYNPDCARRTCLSCKHDHHAPLPCALANPTAVHRLEEDMSNALIRRCGKCATPFVKTDGCNLITCSACATKSCYLCQKVVTDVTYKHFDEPGPCKGFTYGDKSILQNVEAVRKAGLAALESAEERQHAERLKVKVK
ncbi:hypothetical protein JCM10207_004439 [Rhodosporidiobolus poonsookiae]